MCVKGKAKGKCAGGEVPRVWTAGATFFFEALWGPLPSALRINSLLSGCITFDSTQKS